MNNTLIAFDVAKSVFEIAVSQHSGRISERRRLADVALLPPSHVSPYVRRNNTDRADAKGALEAFRNEEIRHLPVRHAQLSWQAREGSIQTD